MNTKAGDTSRSSVFLANLATRFRRREVALWYGAGMSIHSGLPPVLLLVPHLLSGLGMSRREIDAVRDSGVPFEGIMEALAELSDIDPLLDMFADAEPNRNHQFIAELVAGGQLGVVVTTNFDTLIEDAVSRRCREMGLTLAVERSPQDVSKDSDVRVVKVHGCVSDREGLAVTLQSVASRRLFEDRKRVLAEVFDEHRVVVFCGYSCSDIFDLTPAIAALADTGVEIAYLAHQDVDNLHLERVRIDKKVDPFANFKTATSIVGHTDRSIERLWRELLGSAAPEAKGVPPRWQRHAERWLREVCASPVRQTAVAAHVLNTAGEDSQAARFYRAASSHVGGAFEAAPNQRASEYARALMEGNRALNIYRLGHKEEALQIQRRVVEVARAGGDEDFLGSALNNLSIFSHATGDAESACDLAREALAVLDGQDDVRDSKRAQIRASRLGDLAAPLLTLERFAEARDAYHESLELARQGGFKQIEVTALSGLAELAVRLGDYRQAMELLPEVSATAESIGHRRKMFEALASVVNTYTKMGEHRLAQGTLERIEELQVSSDGWYRIAMTHHALGVNLNHMGNLQEARDRFLQAIGCCEEADEGDHALARTSRGFVTAIEGVLGADGSNRGPLSLSLDLEHPERWKKLSGALAYLTGGAEPDLLLPLFRRAAGEDPSDDQSLMNLGVLLRDSGRCREGVAVNRLLVERWPSHAHGWNHLGQCYMNLGQDEAAAAAFQRQLEVDPKYSYAWRNLGELAMKYRQYQEAIHCFREAIAAQPDYAVARQRLEEALRTVKELESAAAKGRS